MSLLSDVSRGVRLLDERVPDWLDRVNPETLNIRTRTDCILGQLYDYYDTGLVVLGLGLKQGWDHGFSGRTVSDEVELTEVWKILINNRRRQASSN